jgi:flagellar hook-length control protein FliK
MGRTAAARQGGAAPARHLSDGVQPKTDTGLQAAPGSEALAGWRQYAAQSPEGPAAAAGGVARQAVARAQAEIVREARYLGRNGSSEITVRLHPPELGRMNVVVQMREGKLDVRIRVEDPQVREAIRAEVQNLDRNLREAHLEPARLEVTDYQAGARDGRQAPMGDGGPSQENGAVQADSGQQAAGGRGWAIFSGTGGVDCLV